MAKATFGPDVKSLCERMESFEASESVAKTGTGSRREGDHFEQLAGELWAAVCKTALAAGAICTPVHEGSRHYALLAVDRRSLIIPSPPGFKSACSSGATHRWLELTFEVEDLVRAFPGETEAIRRYAPTTGPYAIERYPTLYSGLTTRFDDTVLLVDDGVLREKILIEYKTAKSSKGRQIDGNAHERLSFQILQYLEIATKYTACSLTVLANGAFIRYRNKYHVNFHVQADRLANFKWFTMDHACSSKEYLAFLDGLMAWLFDGKPRRK